MNKSIMHIVPLASKISIVLSLLISVLIMAAEGTSNGIIFNMGSGAGIGWVFAFAVFLSFVISYPVIFLVTYLTITLVSRFIK